MAILQNKFVREDGSIIDSSVIISCQYTSEVNSRTNLTVGDVTADSVDVEVRALKKSLVAGEELTYYQIEDGTETKIGVFYVEAPTVATKTSVRFTAYDGIAKLATDFSGWLKENYESFPQTLRQLVAAACEVAGVPMKALTFQYRTLSIPAFYSEGITCRQIISWAAQIAGCFVRCTTDGFISFEWYEKSGVTISAKPSGTYQYMQDGLSKKTYKTDKIQRVQFKQSSDDIGVVYPADASGNCFSIASNSIAGLLDSGTQGEIAEYLYDRLKDITYTPLEVTVKRTSKISAGSIIDVTDANGDTITTYVMRVTTSPRGTTISSTGDQNYADNAAVSSEQYTNMPVRMMELSKSIDGLNIRATSIETRMDDVQSSVASDIAQVQKQVAEIDIRADGIQSSVSSEIEGVKTELSEVRQDATSWSARVEAIEQDGVDKITTGTGITLDKDGLHVDEDGKPTSTLIDASGMDVTRRADGQKLLEVRDTGVKTENLSVRNYVIFGYTRFEKYSDSNDSTQTAMFFYPEGAG